MKKVNVYIYTTVRSPRKKHGAYTYLLEADTSRGAATRYDTGVLENVTAHRAQMTALTEAVRRINKSCNLTIYTDSAYIAACAGKWLDKWKKAGWKNAKGQQVPNMKEWQELSDLLNEHSYQFVVGDSHSYYEWLKAESERAEKNVCSGNHN